MYTSTDRLHNTFTCSRSFTVTLAQRHNINRQREACACAERDRDKARKRRTEKTNTGKREFSINKWMEKQRPVGIVQLYYNIRANFVSELYGTRASPTSCALTTNK